MHVSCRPGRVTANQHIFKPGPKKHLCDIKIYFYSIKINFYSIKYICVISKYIFKRYQKKFVFKKKYFYYIIFFHPINIFFYYMNFPFDTFLVTISGLPYLFVKVRILLSVYKLNSSTIA